MAIACVVGIVVVLAAGLGDEPEGREEGDGVQTFAVTRRSHVSGDVDYPQTPPVGGDHAPAWQNCGFYEAPIAATSGVHSLEHGAVWITFSSDLPQDQKDQIRQLVEGQTCMLASPHPDLQAPVVASAWGKQLTLESAEGPDLEQFVRAFRQGPQTQEPGATCTGGTADTV